MKLSIGSIFINNLYCNDRCQYCLKTVGPGLTSHPSWSVPGEHKFWGGGGGGGGGVDVWCFIKAHTHTHTHSTARVVERRAWSYVRNIAKFGSPTMVCILRRTGHEEWKPEKSDRSHFISPRQTSLKRKENTDLSIHHLPWLYCIFISLL